MSDSKSKLTLFDEDVRFEVYEKVLSFCDDHEMSFERFLDNAVQALNSAITIVEYRISDAGIQGSP